jgi:hypothetical protein
MTLHTQKRLTRSAPPKQGRRLDAIHAVAAITGLMAGLSLHALLTFSPTVAARTPMKPGLSVVGSGAYHGMDGALHVQGRFALKGRGSVAKATAEIRFLDAGGREVGRRLAHAGPVTSRRHPTFDVRSPSFKAVSFEVRPVRR